MGIGTRAATEGDQRAPAPASECRAAARAAPTRPPAFMRGRVLLSLIALVAITAEDLRCADRKPLEAFACGDCQVCTCLPDGNTTRADLCCLKVKRVHNMFNILLWNPVAILAQEICEATRKQIEGVRLPCRP